MSPGSAQATLALRLRIAPPAERAALADRLGVVVGTLSGKTPPTDRGARLQRFEELLAGADPSRVWLALAVLGGELPTAPDVRRAVRAIRLDGVSAAFTRGTLGTLSRWLPGQRAPRSVRVVSDVVLVDVEHTARTGLATGIQRVARETTRRWDRDHDVVFVGWSDDLANLRVLDEAERSRALTGRQDTRPVSPPTEDVVVPWRATYLLPELSPERERNERIAALAEFAECRTGVIGFDCVPISSAETTALGVSEAFAGNLAAVRHMDRVSAISRAAATEYRGWATMLESIGTVGPTITSELLPAEAAPSAPADVAAARDGLGLPGLPLVLCVGTHEPRKNHLAVLHAAELLWREGLRFSLVLIGGRSWNDDRFQAALAAARARNRAVAAPSGIDDTQLWAAYRAARCLVFPSLNEGFGLPVAEALACGTPVITSGYGSMAEIADAGGALLVDPRDDRSIADALRALLVDDTLHAELAAAAAARPVKTWDDYAGEVWTALTATHDHGDR